MEETKHTKNFDHPHPISEKMVRLLANSIYQNLKSEGCKEKDIIGISSQLINLVTKSIETEKNW